MTNVWSDATSIRSQPHFIRHSDFGFILSLGVSSFVIFSVSRFTVEQNRRV